MMSQASLDNADGDWEIQLPVSGRRWIAVAAVMSASALCGFALTEASPMTLLVLLTFFLAAVSGVSGLWSP